MILSIAEANNKRLNTLLDLVGQPKSLKIIVNVMKKYLQEEINRAMTKKRVYVDREEIYQERKLFVRDFYTLSEPEQDWTN